jgi:hypothetical protein
MEDDPRDELRAIQTRARKKAIRHWSVMLPGMLTMVVVWIGATFVVGWLIGGVIGGVAGAVVAVGLDKVLPKVAGVDEE